MLCLHGLGNADHDGGGSGKTAIESILTPLHCLRFYLDSRQLGIQKKGAPEVGQPQI